MSGLGTMGVRVPSKSKKAARRFASSRSDSSENRDRAEGAFDRLISGPPCRNGDRSKNASLRTGVPVGRGSGTAAAADCLSRMVDSSLSRATANRVEANTAPDIAQRIERQIEANVAFYAEHPERIAARLRELDEEWDIERVLETNASTLALSGVVLGVAADRRFLLLPALVAAFLLQHALQGWCPPVPALRRLGIRTAAEIHRERYALKCLRGDFDAVGADGESAMSRAKRALAAVRL